MLKKTPTPLLISLIYIVVSGSYIYLSDIILVAFISNIDFLTTAQSLKGLAFVVVTGLLLYLLLKKRFLIIDEKIAERKKIELEYLDKEESYSTIVNKSNEGILVHSKGEILFANNMFKDRYGVSSEALIGQSIFKFISPEHHEHSLERMKFREEGKKLPGLFELEILDSDHRKRPVEVSVAPINYNGKDSIVVFLRDITERKINEKIIVESEKQFRLLFESASDAILIIKGERYIECNDAAIKLYNGSREEILKCLPADLSPEFQKNGKNSKSESLLNIKKVLIGNSKPFEWLSRKLTGEIFDTEVSLSSFIINDETYIQAIVRDLSERKEAEKELFKEIKFRDNIIASLPGSFYVYEFDKDKTPKLMLWNKYFTDITGYPDDFQKGKSPLHFLHPDDHQTVIEKISKLKPDKTTEVEARIVSKDGSVHPHHFVATGYTDSEKDYFIGFGVDTTERDAARAKIEETQYLLQRITEQSPDFIYIYDVEINKNIYTNKNWGKFLGYEKGEYPENTLDFIDKFIHPDDKIIFDNYSEFVRTWDDDFIYHFQFRLKSKEGKWLWFNGKEKIFNKVNGKVISILGTSRDITTQKLAQRDLTESEKRYKLLTENASEAILVFEYTDENNANFFEINDQTLKLYNYSKEEFFNLKPSDLTPEYQPSGTLSADMRKNYMKKVKENGYHLVEVVHKDKNNNEFVAEIRLIKIPYKGKTLIRSSIIDITERKKIEKELNSYREDLEKKVKERTNEVEKANRALRDSQENLREAQRIAQIAHWQYDLSENKMYWSDEAFKIFGIKKVRMFLELETFFNSIHPDDLEFVKTEINKSKNSNEEMSFVYRIIVDDKTKYISQISRPITNPIGKKSLSVGTFQDITELKIAEEEIRLFQRFANNSSEGYGMVTLDGKTIYQNNALNQLCEIDEFVLNTDVSIYYPPKEKNKIINVIKNILPKEGYWEGETEFVTACGNKRTVYNNYFLLKDDKERPICFAGIIKDISKRKEYEKQLNEAKEYAESANKAKSTFLANMSHEIRTPMNAILGYTQLLLRDSSLNSVQQKNLGIINKSGDHLLTIINDILEISKIEAGRLTLKQNDFNLTTLLNDLKSMISLRATSKGLEVISDFKLTNKIVVSSDEIKIRQILINLLSNAVKFTQNGYIKFSAEILQGKNQILSIAIEDTGHGIDAKEKLKVFEIFEQTESGQKFKGGTGLGLAISKSYTELLNGTLTFESEINKGTTFYLRIPIKLINQDGTVEITKQYDVIEFEQDVSNISILIADDEEYNRTLIEDILTPYNFNLIAAENGKVAIEKFEKEKPDLVLMDLRMPIMNGFDATDYIKSIPEGRLIPIIIITASIFEDNRKIDNDKVDGYIRKPFTEYELLSAIAHSLNLKHHSIKQIKTIEKHSISKEEVENLVTPEIRKMLLHKLTSGDIEQFTYLLRNKFDDSNNTIKVLIKMADDFEIERLNNLLS